MADPLARFSPATREWFTTSFPEPTEAQRLGWPAIAAGEHTLIHAPTGSGKTLAAFLATIDALLHEPLPPTAERCRVLYVSPLKALAYDIERNLRAPLVGIRHAAARMGLDDLPPVETFLRTGDTPADARRRMVRNPPDILITTPESLYLILTSAAREVLRSVRWVICDEVHAVAGTKRGAHLAVSLERLEDLTAAPPQRIGLSATQRPLETTARFLGGGTVDGDVWSPRPVTIVDAPGEHRLDLELVVAVPDMNEPAVPDPLDPDPGATRSIWPAVYPRVLELIRSNRSTIVFANSRRLAERICAEVNALAGEEIARSHHGSVAREQRIQIEEELKRGDLAAVVATSSLELGIDMGAVDLVIQIESPISVASGLQRVGRAGHQVGEVSVAKIFPKYRGDLLLATVVAERMDQRLIEPTRLPRNPLDVLSQQLVAMAVSTEPDADSLFATVRRAAPFAELARPVFDATLDMLAGRYPSDLFAELRPRVTWNRVDGSVTPRPGALQLAVANAGTIPDRGLFRVALPDGARVGELDEEMVYESRPGDVFVLGASSWKITDIGPDRVEVVPAPGEPSARMPFWHGDALGRSLETGRAVGAFVRSLVGLPEDRALPLLRDRYHLDEWAAENLVAYLSEQREATGTVPSDETIVVERFRDEIGDWRVVLLSPLGARVHAPWAMAVTHRLRERTGTDVDVIWSDDGIAFRFVDTDSPPGVDELLVDPDEIEGLLVDHLADTALFASRFREAAGRALLLPRRRPGQRSPLWLQRRKAADLLAVAKQFGSFPIVLETYREILQDDFDLPGLEEVLRSVRDRRTRVVEVDTRSPSPFASNLLFSFVAAFLYEGDTPLAERRAAALTLDRDLLRELLGEGELRELLDGDAVARVELELQRLTPERAAHGPDGIADLLRDLGPLDIDGVRRRTSDDTDPDEAVVALERDHRLIRIRWQGEDRLAAVEDAGRLRDALGIQPPPGVPHVFLDPVDDPLGDVVGRYARTHGPFTESGVAADLGLGVAIVRTTLQRLETSGRVARGAFRPGGSGVEWIDTEVLRRLKRRSLATLRSEIEPVDQAAFARFLPAWQGVRSRLPSGIPALAEAVDRLQGAAVPASVLERDVLASRVSDPDLDRLMTSGELVWVGRGPLGARDGRVALYTRDTIGNLWTDPGAETPAGPVHDDVRRVLHTHGASFFRTIYEGCGGGDPGSVLDALWDLVWAGEVTNDSYEPVRAFTARRRSGSGRRRPPLASSFPPHAAGRWSLVAPMLTTPPEATIGATEWARRLLDRHGILTRPGVLAESLPGGFSGLYPVLTRMEETGRVRRGYFVEGLGGAQFAMPGAVDRIRAPATGEVVALAATDPANPFGAALDWPEIEEGRIGRFAGAYVVLADGRLAAMLDGRRLRVLDGEPDLRRPIAGALGDIAARHSGLRIESVDGASIHATPWTEALTEHGFVTTTRGVTMRRR